MGKLTVERSFKVKCNLTADDWQLYPNCEAAVVYLNAAVERIAAEEAHAKQFFDRMSEVLIKFSDCGAADSEGFEVLEDITDRIYKAR